MRSEVFYLSVMTKHVVVTSRPKRQPQKSSNVDSIGPTYLEMHMNTVEVVLGANKWVESLKET